MATTHGNLADLRTGDGKLILDIHDAGEPVLDPGGYDHHFTASIRGWHRGHNTGTGSTKDAAIRDLAKKCGLSAAELLAQCETETV